MQLEHFKTFLKEETTPVQIAERLDNIIFDIVCVGQCNNLSDIDIANNIYLLKSLRNQFLLIAIVNGHNLEFSSITEYLETVK
jgi:hypothetical protein